MGGWFAFCCVASVRLYGSLGAKSVVKTAINKFSYCSDSPREPKIRLSVRGSYSAMGSNFAAVSVRISYGTVMNLCFVL